MIRHLRQLFQRLRSSLPSGNLDRELDAEIASHIELATEENIRRGMTEQEARRHALVRFGGMEQAKQQQRDARGFYSIDVLMQDFRYAFRTVRRDPVFTAIAVLILAIGIGTNIAVFSVVNTILLRPLPLQNPQELVWIANADAKSGLSSMTYSVDAYQEYQSQNRSFQDVTSYFAFSTGDNFKLMGHGQPLPFTAISVAGNFFQVLGVEPPLGRLFTADECLKNGRPAVLLAHAFWQQQFGSDPKLIGQAITLNGQPVTVVGVLPGTFDFGGVFSPGAKVDMYVPAIMDDMREWGNTLALVGRLKPGVSVAQAQAEANLVFPTLHFNIKHPEWRINYTASLKVLKEYVSGKVRRSLVVLWSAVGLILLIVCVNLSNLMLARAAARSKEFAMRTALGAGRGRLVRQLLTESFVLSGIGALLGLSIAYGITAYLSHQASIALPLLSNIRVDSASLVWTLFITVIVAVLFGLVPGLKAAGGNLQEALKDTGHGMSEGRKHERLRATLVISEVALACVLLIGAGLLLRSFLRVLEVDLGFDPSRTAAIKIEYTDEDNAEKRGAILHDILGRVRALPGIEAAGISDNLPLSMNRSWGLAAKGKKYRPDELPGTFVYIVTPGYLNAIGMRLLEGRDITWLDNPKTEPVAIINQTVERNLWPGEDAVGHIGVVNGTETRIIGIVADVRESNPEDPSGWQMYLPATQAGPVGAELVVRSSLPADVVASSVMSTLRSLNPGQPATEFQPLQQIVNHALSPRRFFVLLVAAFAALGLVLASIGIYGVISYSVTRRTQEIGIRMALGATAANVQFGVISRTLRLALLGIALGTIASIVMAKSIASLLFGTAPTDPMAYLSMILLLAAVAFVAGYLPARRASRIDPMIALRNN